MTPSENKKSHSEYSNEFLLWMSASIICITFVYIFCITFLAIPKENQRFADTILGFLSGTLLSTIINFFFGSSNNNKVKETTPTPAATSVVAEVPVDVTLKKEETSKEEVTIKSGEEKEAGE